MLGPLVNVIESRGEEVGMETTYVVEKLAPFKHLDQRVEVPVGRRLGHMYVNFNPQ